jgi:hypothetical protein
MVGRDAVAGAVLVLAPSRGALAAAIIARQAQHHCNLTLAERIRSNGRCKEYRELLQEQLRPPHR